MRERMVEAVVIGAGPGGYVAALRLAHLKKQVLLVEKKFLGGVCLNVGCIPSKALITAAKLYEKVHHAKTMGIQVGTISLDMEKLQEWKQGVVQKLTKGIQHLCRKTGVDILFGSAQFIGERLLRVRAAGKEETVRAENIIIATGSRPVDLPGFRFDQKYILSSTEVQELTSVPARMIIIGGGYIGLELGMMYSKLGAQITVVEMMDQLLPGFDKDLVETLQERIKKQQIEFHTSTRAREWRVLEKAGGVEVTAETPRGEKKLRADFVLLTVGRIPSCDNLGIEKTGLFTDARGWIPVNRKLQTQVPGIYAIGDVAGEPMLAHKATREAEVAAEVIAGLPSELDYRAMPVVVFTDPEIASVGLFEDDARQKGYALRIGKFPFLASGRALTAMETDGYVKVVAEAESNRLLGVHIIGPEASNLIGEAALAVEMGCSVEDVAHTIHAHPTFPEALMESAKHALKQAIHIGN